MDSQSVVNSGRHLNTRVPTNDGNMNKFFTASHTTTSVAHSIPKALKWGAVILSVTSLLLVETVGLLIGLSVHPFSLKLLIHSMHFNNPITILLMATVLTNVGLIAVLTTMVYKFVTRKKISNHLEESSNKSPSPPVQWLDFPTSSFDASSLADIIENFFYQNSHMTIDSATNIQVFKQLKVTECSNMKVQYSGCRNVLCIRPNINKDNLHILLLDIQRISTYKSKIKCDLTGEEIFHAIAVIWRDSDDGISIQNIISGILSHVLPTDINTNIPSLAASIAGVFVSEFKRLLCSMYSNDSSMISLEVFNNCVGNIKQKSTALMTKNSVFKSDIDYVVKVIPDISLQLMELIIHFNELLEGGFITSTHLSTSDSVNELGLPPNILRALFPKVNQPPR